MRLLRYCNTGNISLTRFDKSETIPSYAILSHTWGTDAEEVTFEDLITGTGKDKLGYKKIRFCAEQAKRDGLQYFWVDTCCIDKTNAAELSTAINSMFRWYRNATRCYVYLSDISSPFTFPEFHMQHPEQDGGKSDSTLQHLELDIRKSKWFTRGWTLQELLAPSSVEFFSQEWKRLGDRISLKRLISEITAIPDEALQGAPLFQFTDNERYFWMQHRRTKVEEDKAYALLGIFGVNIPLDYGEGRKNAFERLEKEIAKVKKCIQDLRCTDPYGDKKRIEETKGGLLDDSYRWILFNADFQRWRSDELSRLFWIKGDPGKGKTMLLCGIINELHNSVANTAVVSYFFCQATDSRINSATAVLRGLLYMLVNQQPSLISHVQKRHDYAGKAVFEDTNAWVPLSEIVKDILQDPSLNIAYLIIDALDECVVGLPMLLELIKSTSSLSTRVKWLLSSRNENHIEQRLRSINTEARLSLELKENAELVARAVNIYIDHKLSYIESVKDDKLRDQIRDILRKKANGTFLWVALVVQELNKPESLDPLEVVQEAPEGLDELYDRMVEQIQQLTKRNSEICRLLLSTVSVAYRPLYLAEIGSLCGLSQQISTYVAMCGSFLTIREHRVYLIHQSAKEYLSDKMRIEVFYSQGKIHHKIFSQALKLMSSTLKRDMHGLAALKFPTNKDTVTDYDPLAALRYSCIHWIDHLCDVFSSEHTKFDEDLQDGSIVHIFLKERYLYWLEALSRFESMPEGVKSMGRLEALLLGRLYATTLMELVQDARRFITYHKTGIELSPLQTYASALVFSPTRSIIRGIFRREKPDWITIKPAIHEKWSACFQTLEGHSRRVNSVAFSHDSVRLASASGDGTVKIWDTTSGECLQTLESGSDSLSSVANSVTFSHDSTRLASAYDDFTIKIWDASSGECLQTLQGHSDSVSAVVFSHDSTRLASTSYDRSARIWDASSGKCLQTFESHNNSARATVFSHDLTMLASATALGTIQVWVINSGECLQMLEGHIDWVDATSFSHDSTRLASGDSGGTVKVWDTSSGICLQTIDGHSDLVSSLVFSHDSTMLMSASQDMTAKIWDSNSGKHFQTLEGHSSWVNSAIFSHDSTMLASASNDDTVKIWDASGDEPLQMVEGHGGNVNTLVFSHDSTMLVSGSHDGIVKIWDVSSGDCLQTLKGYGGWASVIVFSHDSTRLASGDMDGMVKIWDTGSGKCLQTLKHINWVTSVVFSHDSIRLASASYDGIAKIWNVSSGECLQTFESHSDSVNPVVFSHDSTRLASAYKNKTVKIWNVSSGECLQTLEGHSNSVGVTVFSHDSTMLMSAPTWRSYEGIVKIWDVSSGECLQTLQGHSDSVSAAVFSHDSTMLASASTDHTLRIWDSSSGECLHLLNIGRTLFYISFDIDNSYLHTEIGAIKIGALSSLRTTQSPQYSGLALSADGVWITYNSKNSLWLPSEYRPSCSAWRRNTIGIGVGSGRVWICKVESSKS